MKQNSRILFHYMHNTLTHSYLRSFIFAGFTLLFTFSSLALPTTAAAAKPEYLASFDPAKGFKPAQSDLTEVFLQIAGSLEYYGSPEPYLRHMQAEHERIEAKYRERLGTTPKSYRPAYMTDAYFEQLSANWKLLAPKLGLEPLTKATGNLMRDAILGTRGTGTILVGVFNKQQQNVYAGMSGKLANPPDLDVLKAELIKRLYLDQTVIHDENFKMAERDAVDFTSGIHGAYVKLFRTLDSQLKSGDAERLKKFVTNVCDDVGRMAESELEAGIIETALDRQASAKAAAAH